MVLPASGTYTAQERLPRLSRARPPARKPARKPPPPRARRPIGPPGGAEGGEHAPCPRGPQHKSADVVSKNLQGPPWLSSYVKSIKQANKQASKLASKQAIASKLPLRPFFPNRLATGVLGYACLGTCVFRLHVNKLASTRREASNHEGTCLSSVSFRLTRLLACQAKGAFHDGAVRRTLFLVTGPRPVRTGRDGRDRDRCGAPARVVRRVWCQSERRHSDTLTHCQQPVASMSDRETGNALVSPRTATAGLKLSRPLSTHNGQRNRESPPPPGRPGGAGHAI